MQVAAGAEFLPGVDQPLMDRIELVGVGGNDLPLDRLLEPGPLKDRGLENRSRRIRVVFQKFRRAVPAETEVEPAIEAQIVAVPAFRDQRPEGLRYLQPPQIFLIADGAADEFKAHGVDFAGGCFDLSFDLIQRERIIGAFVPVALVVDGMKIESAGFGGDPPVVSLRTDDAPHRRPLAAAMGMAVAVQTMWRFSEAAG